MGQTEHRSEHARTYEEAERLVEGYRLFAAPARFVVGASTWDIDPRGEPTWACQGQFELQNFCRAANGNTELDIGDRYQLVEPFDIEFSEHGFVVWSAATVLVARNATYRQQRAQAQRGPQFLAPRMGGTKYGAASSEGAFDAFHDPFTLPTQSFLDAIKNGAPVTGLVDLTEFPLTSHGWGPAVIDTRFPPVTIDRW